MRSNSLKPVSSSAPFRWIVCANRSRRLTMSKGSLIGMGRGWNAWFLLNFAMWWKEFIDGRGATEMDQEAMERDL